MIVDAYGQGWSDAPRPNPLLEERVNAELKKLDELLFIQWHPFAYFNDVKNRWEGRYGLFCKWPSIDKRWLEVREGRMNPDAAFDLLWWFTEDVHDASSVPQDPEAVMSLTLKRLYESSNVHFPWRERMARMIENNKRVYEKQKEEMQDRAQEVVNDYYYHSSLASRVFMPVNPIGGESKDG